MSPRRRRKFPLLLAFVMAIAVPTVVYNAWFMYCSARDCAESKPQAVMDVNNYYYVYLEDPNSVNGEVAFQYNQSWPRIALFMTYPNSGTTFTLDSVSMLSEYDTGTNYNGEVYDEIEQIFNHTKGGPYWHNGSIKHLPDMKSFILTKTHCTGFCFDCATVHSIINFTEFDKSCRLDVSGIREPYPQAAVSRIVRIIREPLSNAVSRFHHARSTILPIRKSYMDNRSGFLRFCLRYRKKYRAEEDLIFVRNLTRYFDDIPCGVEFFRFVQWHNHANRFVQEYQVPSLFLYYERLNDQSFETLLEFLNLERRNLGKDVVKNSWKSYLDYYTDEEKVKIWNVIKMLASNETMKLLEPYLNGLENFPSAE